MTASRVSDGAARYAETIDKWSPLFRIPRLWGWQKHTLAMFADRRADGTPRYSTCVVIICRQNGKTTLLYPLILDRLSRGQRIMFAMHQRMQAKEKFEDIALALTRAVPGRFAVSRATGRDRITDKVSGGRFRLVTGDDKGGRSDTADLIIVDEAAHIHPSFLKAARATTITRPDAQVIMISSGMTDYSTDLGAARERAYEDLISDDPRFGVLEWAAKTTPGIDDLDISDEELWARCIPTLGLAGGATLEAVRDELGTQTEEVFAREYLSVPTGSPDSPPISAEDWSRCTREKLPPTDRLRNRVIAIDTSPDQGRASVCLAATVDGRPWAAMLANDSSDGWLLEETAAIAAHLRPLYIVTDQRSPSASIAERLRTKGHRVEGTGAQFMASACAAFVTAVRSERLSVLRNDVLTLAATTAIRRNIADVGWAWNRRDGTDLDITPLVACSLALYQQHIGVAL